MPTPYSPGGGRSMPWFGHLGAVELVGDLDQDAGAVAHQLVGADRAAVVEVLEDLQALRDDAVRALALDVGDEADAAGIVFVGRVVQAFGGGGFEFLAGGDAHVARSTVRLNGTARLLHRSNTANGF